jgi:hypothetical protein
LTDFRVLAVNFPRLGVTALAERLNLTGFRTDGPDADPDDALWRVWRRNGMEDAAAQPTPTRSSTAGAS